MADFYLNNINDVGGPNIFATRLRDALVEDTCGLRPDLVKRHAKALEHAGGNALALAHDAD